MTDANQIRIWKAALVPWDGRMRWPRALSKAIRMIESRDRREQLLRNAGQSCSNICFNLAQSDQIKPEHRESMRIAALAWDVASKS